MPVRIEAGTRIRWSASAKRMRATCGTARPMNPIGPQKAVTVPASRVVERKINSHGRDVESHRAGVVFAQQEQVQRFDDRDGQHESENDGRKQQTELSERNVAERSHRPDDERFEGGFVAQVLQDLHDGSDTRRKHHAQDENDHDVFDSAADRSDQHQDQRRADPGSARNAEGGD